MHQIKPIPNNNTEFSFEKADRKTLENILKDLENQEKELLKESTQKAEKKYWENRQKYNQRSKSLFNLNFHNPNLLNGDHLKYHPHLNGKNHAYWYNDGSGFFSGGMKTFGTGFDFPTLFQSQAHLAKINQHTMFEINNFNPQVFDTFPLGNYPAIDLNGFDMNKYNSSLRFSNNIQMPAIPQLSTEGAFLQKSKSAYIIKPKKENHPTNQTFDLSRNTFLNDNSNKTFYSTPKLISKNNNIQFFPKNIPTLDENKLRKTLNNVNMTLNKFSNTTLEEKVKNNAKKPVNKVYKQSSNVDVYYLPEHNKTTDFSIQEKYSKKNLVSNETFQTESNYFKSKSFHDSKMFPKIDNSLNEAYKTNNLDIKNELSSIEKDLLSRKNAHNSGIISNKFSAQNATHYKKKAAKVDLSRSVDFPTPTPLNFKVPVKITKNNEESTFLVKAKKSKSFNEPKKILEISVPETNTISRSNQNSFYKDLKLADINTFKSTIEYHEDDNIVKNKENFNASPIPIVSQLNRTCTSNRSMLNATSDELEEIFSNKKRVNLTKNLEVMSKPTIEHSEKQIKLIEPISSQVKIIQKKVKEESKFAISNKPVMSAFKCTNTLSKSKTETFDGKNLFKPVSEIGSNRKNFTPIENVSINEISKKNIQVNLFKPNQSNQNFNNANNFSPFANSSQANLKYQLKEKSSAFISPLVKKNGIYQNPRVQVSHIQNWNEPVDEKKRMFQKENAFIQSLFPQNINSPYETEEEKEKRLREICDYLREELDFKKSEGSLSSGYDSPSSSNSLVRENLFETNKSLNNSSKSKTNFDQEMPCEEAFGYLIVDLNQFEQADEVKSMNSRKLWIKDIPIYVHENSTKSSIQIFS